MTNRITLNPQDGIDKFIINRTDIEGEISLTISAADTDVKINVGRCAHQAEQLHDALQAAADAAKALVDDWEDKPDDFDAYVSVDRGNYYVQLENKAVGTFPTKEIAIIELAQAMVDAGHFANAWYQYDAYTVPLDDEVRAYQDEGGDQMRPLGGQYNAGDDVKVNHRYQTDPMTWEHEWIGAEVIKDYGDAGVVYVIYGDDEQHVIDDRENIRPYPKDDDGAD